MFVYNPMVAKTLGAMQTHQADVNKALTQLATGKKINQASDDPSGLIAANQMQQSLADLDASIAGNQRSAHLLNTAEGVLAEFQSMLHELNSIVQSTSNESALSDEEKQAAQQEADSLIQSMNRLLKTSEFNGQPLFDGSVDFLKQAMTSGIDVIDLFKATFPEIGELTAEIEVTQPADLGRVFLDFDQASLDETAQTLWVTIEGDLGSVNLGFAPGATLAEMAEMISEHAEETGVTAEVDGNTIGLQSQQIGEDSFVGLKVISDGGQVGRIALGHQADPTVPDLSTAQDLSALGSVEDFGQSVQALVNGEFVQGEGATLQLNTTMLEGVVQLTDETAQTAGAIESFHLAGGGLRLKTGGSSHDPFSTLDTRYSLHMNTVESLDLLRAGQVANLKDGDRQMANQIVDHLSHVVAARRAEIGNIQRYEIDTMNRVMNIEKENTASALSAIEDADYAKAVSQFSRSQLLLTASQESFKVAIGQQQRIVDLLATATATTTSDSIRGLQ